MFWFGLSDPMCLDSYMKSSLLESVCKPLMFSADMRDIMTDDDTLPRSDLFPADGHAEGGGCLILMELVALGSLGSHLLMALPKVDWPFEYDLADYECMINMYHFITGIWVYLGTCMSALRSWILRFRLYALDFMSGHRVQ